MPAQFPPTTPVASLLVTSQPVSSFDMGNKPANFAYERPSTSLGDLEIVRKIVEREGCIEALQHLVNPSSSLPSATTEDTKLSLQHRELEMDIGYCYMGPRSVSASRKSLSAIGGVSPMVAPMVMQSVLDQLRVVGVQVVEMIAKWRQATRDAQTFQWRGLNYLLKMTTDLDFLASCATTIEPLRALRLERNPLLSALHLDHPLLVREARRESITPEVTAQLQRLLPDVSVHAGGVDRARLFEASKVLAAELAAERRRQQLKHLSDQFGGGGEDEEDGDAEEDAANASVPPASAASSVTKSVHWSHRPVTFITRPLLGSAGGGQSFTPTTSTPTTGDAEDELVVTRELLAQTEHELGALREQLATLQRQLKDADEGVTPPLPLDKRRRLQTRIGGMVNDLKFRSGDVFQRRNELRRREKASDRKGQQQQPQAQQPTRHAGVGSASRSTKPAAPAPGGSLVIASPGLLSLVGLDDAELLEETLQHDELRRHEIVDRFAHLRVTATTAARQRARSAPAIVRRATRGGSGGGSAHKSSSTHAEFETSSMTYLTADDVQQFVDALGLGLAPLSVSTASVSSETSRLTYGALFKAQGIDGALLAAATDRDLEELGVSLRLHRVRILDAVRAAQ